MSRFARKLSRRHAVDDRLQTVDEERFLRAHLAALAAESLGLSADDVDDAERGGPTVDVATARMLELLECLGSADEETSRTRAELERRNGPGFLARVAAMGEPARKALRRVGLLGAFVLALLLWPGAAQASSPPPPRGEVDIMYRLRDRRRRTRRGERVDDGSFTTNFGPPHRRPYSPRRGGGTGRGKWIGGNQWIGSCAGCARRSASRRASRGGCVDARSSSGAAARRTKSSSAGDDASSVSATPLVISRTSRFSGRTGRSNDRPTSEGKRLRVERGAPHEKAPDA